MRRDDSVYLRHVLDALGKIETYLAGVDHGTFRASTLIQDAVIRQLEIVGEAVKRVSSATRARALDVPWPAIAGMRDKLIHDYFGVDLEQVWITATTDAPSLKVSVTALLAGEADPNANVN